MTFAVRVNNLGKCYRLGRGPHQSLRDTINSAAARIFGRPNPTSVSNRATARNGGGADTFWALRDISFELNPGEVWGIIGRNGAGKSTLLKMLSQIVAPTTGRIELQGRVASLLEVGTGFHPELSGRENVYLNGTILGMTRSEVRKKFDEIVSFAGVERFIDTPVKRYSSGMAVRLGFAVAAHLEAEILIVDEVLAVGDIEFQRKCVAKMQGVAESGKTVLFVSHNMVSIRSLTSRSMVLSNGSIVYSGTTSEAVARYISENEMRPPTDISARQMSRPFDGLSREIEFESLCTESGPLPPIEEGESLVIYVGVRAQQVTGSFVICLTVFRDDDSPVGSTFSAAISPPPVGELREYRLQLPTSQLARGKYSCGISLADARSGARRLLDSLTGVLAFSVEAAASTWNDWPSVWGPIQFPEIQVMESRAKLNDDEISPIVLVS